MKTNQYSALYFSRNYMYEGLVLNPQLSAWYIVKHLVVWLKKKFSTAALALHLLFVYWSIFAEFRDDRKWSVLEAP